MDNASPEVNPGKAFQNTAEKVFDEIAEEQGIDEYGDEIVDIEDDESALEAEGTETVIDDDAPAVEVADPEQTEAPADGSVAEAGPVSDGPEPLAPHTWPDEWKQTFNNLPPEARRNMAEMNRQMNAGFTKRMTEIAEMRRDMEGVRSQLTPHQDRLARAGISPEVAVQRSLAWDAHIQRNPQQGIMDMAKAYGVDLAQAIQPAQNEQYLTPTERMLKQQLDQSVQSVQQIQQQQEQWQQHQQQSDFQQRQANAYGMLDEFMNATDESGNQLHPYIEHCAPVMTRLIQTGAVQDLDTAYNMAAAAIPEVQQARAKMRQTKSIQENKRKVEKVRKASGGIVDKSSGKGQKPTRSMEDQVSSTYDKIVNA